MDLIVDIPILYIFLFLVPPSPSPPSPSPSSLSLSRFLSISTLFYNSIHFHVEVPPWCFSASWVAAAAAAAAGGTAAVQRRPVKAVGAGII